MSNVFAITAATNSVRLDAKRHGETSFTVSNTSGRAMRGRPRLEAENPAASAWLTVVGEAERDLAIAGTTQYTVQIAVPADAPPGNYPFRLDMVGVENPDELYTQGPSVTFEVPAPPPKKRFPWWIVLVIGGVLLLGGIATAVILLLPHDVEVPNLTGLSAEAAQSALQDAGLELTTVPQSESSETVARGSVIRTDPPAGDKVKQGSAVTLVFSTGSKWTNVPDVSTLTVEQAITVVQGAGLTVAAAVPRPDDTVPKDSVVGTTPPANSQVLVGSGVILIVSSGSAFVEVPNVAGQDTAVARTTLEGASLVVTATLAQKPDPTAPVGSVVGTYPVAGTKVAPGTMVMLVVSSGPDVVVIPDVSGQLPDAAKTKLQGDRLTVGQVVEEHSATMVDGKVTRTEPAAGTAVTPGSAVRLYVSSGPLGSRLEDFLCAWVNVDSAESKLTGLTIEKMNDSTLLFQGFYECGGNTCDTGIIKVPFTPMKVTAKQESDTSSATITVERDGALLKVSGYWTGSSGQISWAQLTMNQMQCPVRVRVLPPNQVRPGVVIPVNPVILPNP